MSVHSEFLALLATLPGTPPIHDGLVPDTPGLPYVLVSAFVPRVSERSLNRTPHARATKWRTTITSSNPTSVAIVARNVSASLEGARIEGQRLEAVPNDLPILEDTDVTLGDAHPHYAVLEWRLST